MSTSSTRIDKEITEKFNGDGIVKLKNHSENENAQEIFSRGFSKESLEQPEELVH